MYDAFSKAHYAVDSFHVVININKGLDNVRIRIMKVSSKDQIDYYLLKISNGYYWERKSEKITASSINVKTIIPILNYLSYLNISPVF